VAAGASEVEVEIVGLFEQEVTLRDEQHRIPVMVLRDPATREVRVPVGSCEGLAIQIAIERQVFPRPLTHDLAVRLLEKLSARLERIVIDKLSDEESRALLHLKTPQGAFAMEARPGDAIALALRAEAPIFVTEDVLAGGGGAEIFE
jgi:bifunctional DNase/RNase